MFSSGCRPRLKNAVLELPNDNPPHELSLQASSNINIECTNMVYFLMKYTIFHDISYDGARHISTLSTSSTVLRGHYGNIRFTKVTLGGLQRFDNTLSRITANEMVCF